jgi:uncharacterized protein involved in tellurium resistance
MSVTLPKGGNLPLAGIQRVRIELTWSAPAGPGPELDGVVAVASGAEPRELLLAHQVPNPAEGPSSPLTAPSGGIETDLLEVTLTAVPAGVTVVQLGAAIYDSGHGGTFRAVRGARIQLANAADGVEIARFEVASETGQEKALVFGELYRHSSGWKFRAVGQGYANGLAGFAAAGQEVMPARPADVAGFLRRTSPARSRRKVADHLRPPRPAARPAAAPSRPAAPSGPRAASPQRPPSPPAAAPRPPVVPPAAARSPLDLDARTHRPAPPAGAAGRSPLDLGGDSYPPPAAPSPLDLGGSSPAGPGGRSPVELGPSAAGTGAAGHPPPRAGRPAPPGGGGSLDLDTPVAASSGPSGGPTGGLGRLAGDIAFGERSSRHRQRAERVGALDDDHPVTAWTAEQRGAGALTVTLRWTQLTTRAGLPRPSDLQLGCFWQALDGSSGLLQAVGAATTAPGGGGGRQVLALAPRDERDGQKMFVDLRSMATLKRFFVFAYGLHGAPEWEGLRPRLTVAARGGETLEIPLGDAPAGARTCLVASFHVAQDDLVIRRENDFHEGPQAEAAVAYGWSLDWNPDGSTLRDR